MEKSKSLHRQRLFNAYRHCQAGRIQGQAIKLLVAVFAALGLYLSYGAGQDGQEPSLGVWPTVQKVLGTVFPGAQPQPAATPSTGVFEARVLKVADGDTLTVQDPDGARRKVRLFAIDAPELAQSHGQAAHVWLEKLVAGQPVKVRVVTIDKYQRLVAQVFVPNPMGCDTPDPLEPLLCEGDHDLNLAAVQAGHAWWYRFYSKEQNPQDRVQYAAAQEQARAQRKGLWAGVEPQAPWDWRRGNKR
jgi:endonuclease YncB( thermonuclease family)